MTELLLVLGAVALVMVNGFFVAAEFALVKVRPSRLDQLVRQGRPFARVARWFVARLDASLSACQLGITMASLGLGWIGEPAVARLLEPVFHGIGITSAAVVHGLAFGIGFTIITGAHLVIGEQTPKIFAIRRPESMLLWCAAPLAFFYALLYPFLITLTAVTTALLRTVGIDSASEHDQPHSEGELRLLLSQAHAHGEISLAEHRLLHAVFEFDDLVCRRVMVPRVEVVFFEVDLPLRGCLDLAVRTRHTRFPVCEGSLDNAIGVVHVKNLLGVDGGDAFDLRSLMRPPRYVPETMPISRLLRHFQASHNHLAFVVDEYGTVAGIVTLENVLEQIVGPVEDEFDVEPPAIVPDGPGRFVVLGAAAIGLVNRRLGLDLPTGEADTLSGLLVARTGHLPAAGECIDLDRATAEIIEVRGNRATRVRIILPDAPAAGLTAG